MVDALGGPSQAPIETVTSQRPTQDAAESARAPKFGDVYKDIQAKFGEKPEKPREIKKTLDKDDFLKIMISQMKNQDPTSPFKAEQMATQMAQFTSVEQLHNINQNINKMSSQNRPLEQMAMTNLIGKVVTVDRNRFPHIEGQTDHLSFHLPKDAKEVSATLISETGEEVLKKDLGSQKSGEVTFNWDGIKANTIPAKAGNYLMRIEAKDDQGRNLETNPTAQGRVIGVTFNGSEPILLVGDAAHQEKVTLQNITRIEVPADQAGAKGFTPVVDTQNQGQNFFNFQKGIGSTEVAKPAIDINPKTAPPVRENLTDKVIEKVPEEKGFPNGLSELIKGGDNG